jgi:hypothetical protein
MLYKKRLHELTSTGLALARFVLLISITIPGLIELPVRFIKFTVLEYEVIWGILVYGVEAG